MCIYVKLLKGIYVVVKRSYGAFSKLFRHFLRVGRKYMLGDEKGCVLNEFKLTRSWSVNIPSAAGVLECQYPPLECQYWW